MWRAVCRCRASVTKCAVRWRFRLRAVDPAGNLFELEAEGLLARAILHEIDHLDGILFTDRLSGLRKERARRLLKRLAKGVGGFGLRIPLRLLASSVGVSPAGLQRRRGRRRRPHRAPDAAASNSDRVHSVGHGRSGESRPDRGYRDRSRPPLPHSRGDRGGGSLWHRF